MARQPVRVSSPFEILKPHCSHGVRIDRFCAECSPPRPVRPRPSEQTSTLVGDLARATRALGPVELNLPPLGPHSASADRARGFWTVRCGCGRFCLRSRDVVELEEAWGRHRGETHGR